jgi:hypothetical protein
MMAVNAWRNELDDAAKRLKLRRRIAAAMIVTGGAVVLGVLYSIFGSAAVLLVAGILAVIVGLTVLGE